MKENTPSPLMLPLLVGASTPSTFTPLASPISSGRYEGRWSGDGSLSRRRRVPSEESLVSGVAELQRSQRRKVRSGKSLSRVRHHGFTDQFTGLYRDTSLGSLIKEKRRERLRKENALRKTREIERQQREVAVLEAERLERRKARRKVMRERARRERARREQAARCIGRVARGHVVRERLAFGRRDDAARTIQRVLVGCCRIFEARAVATKLREVRREEWAVATIQRHSRHKLRRTEALRVVGERRKARDERRRLAREALEQKAAVNIQRVARSKLGRSEVARIIARREEERQRREEARKRQLQEEWDRKRREELEKAKKKKQRRGQDVGSGGKTKGTRRKSTMRLRPKSRGAPSLPPRSSTPKTPNRLASGTSFMVLPGVA